MVPPFDLIHQLLDDEAPDIRAAAARALSLHWEPQHAPEPVADALEGALADPDATVRWEALVALRRLGLHALPSPPAQPVVPPRRADAPTNPRFPWASWLAHRSWQELQGSEGRLYVPEAVIASGWLGYPGVSTAQLEEAEERLGRRLPPSYREFLQVTNGWRGGWMPHWLWPLEEVEPFCTREPDWAKVWLEGRGQADLTEAEHLASRARHDPVHFRRAYLRTAIQVSEAWDGNVYLLNSEVVTAEGEWEAWLFGNKLPGAERWPSFWEMLQDVWRT
jgi:hypothetical protein